MVNRIGLFCNPSGRSQSDVTYKISKEVITPHNFLDTLSCPFCIAKLEWKFKKYYAQRGARTHDPGIKSPMLYRLS